MKIEQNESRFQWIYLFLMCNTTSAKSTVNVQLCSKSKFIGYEKGGNSVKHTREKK